ncbi:MAG: SDR family NAD(P)-dependent oxidoreductase [Dehalococcoidales bacterium]|nr:SDR family NAD(P)-dependent oxidoreductase [Dehalococcoidales bacterium]
MNFFQNSLDGRVAILTGGSRGIGKAISLAFARAGADIVLASRKLPDLEQTAAEIMKPGRRALAIETHISHASARSRLIEAATSEFGKIDILINDAGTGLAPYFTDGFGGEGLGDVIMKC